MTLGGSSRVNQFSSVIFICRCCLEHCEFEDRRLWKERQLRRGATPQ